MANNKIKKIQLGSTTYDIAVDNIDKVEGLQEALDSKDIEIVDLTVLETSEDE